MTIGDDMEIFIICTSVIIIIFIFLLFEFMTGVLTLSLLLGKGMESTMIHSNRFWRMFT